VKPLPRYIAILEFITAAGLVIFWAAFFTIGLAPENPPPSYFDFEHAFPLPDFILAIALFSGGILVLQKTPYGTLLSIAAAGALIFLGLVDFSFNFQQGMYATSFAESIMNAIINVWSIGLGLLILFKAQQAYR